MLTLTGEQKIYYTLRIASAMCFIGHGAFGIITKQIWTNYFGVFGIGYKMSFKLMPVIGIIDIFMGIIILLYPLRAVVAWLMIWGITTALLRPLSGEPFAEFLERAGNFGAPLVLIILAGNFNFHAKKLFTPLSANVNCDLKKLLIITRSLQVIAFLLFAGHGWLNFIEKKSLVDQYFKLGFINPGNTAQVMGLMEIAAAFTILFRPVKSIILLLFIWKIISELFYPQHEFFEWMERGGSYGVLLALYFALDLLSIPVRKFSSANEKNLMPQNLFLGKFYSNIIDKIK